MIACILIPAFELRAALRTRPGLALGPAALSPGPGSEAVVGAVNALAMAAGVKPGMRLGEALGTCPALALVEPDPSAAGQAWEEILRRLEEEGLGVEPDGLGCAYFDTATVERLYGSVDAVLRRALAAVGPVWDPRAGAAPRRFAALAAASVARPGQALAVGGDEATRFLAPLPLTLLPLERERYAELEGLGLRSLGDLARLPGAAVAERLGPDGSRAWQLARGEGADRVHARKPAGEIVESLEFPDAVDNEITLRRALDSLLERALERPERAGRAVRKVALSARLVGGGSWRRALTLREPTADLLRLRVALTARLAGLPSPATALALELVELAEWTGQQLELVRPEGAEMRSRLREGLRQVRASAGGGAVCAVVEVEPWSRIPERRAVLVPREG